MRRFVLSLEFLIGSPAGFFARQRFSTGHTSHFGFRATQIAAPRSRRAELKVAPSDFGRRRFAWCQSFRRPASEWIDSRKLKSPPQTRPVFASTIGTDS